MKLKTYSDLASLEIGLLKELKLDDNGKTLAEINRFSELKELFEFRYKIRVFEIIAEDEKTVGYDGRYYYAFDSQFKKGDIILNLDENIIKRVDKQVLDEIFLKTCMEKEILVDLSKIKEETITKEILEREINLGINLKIEQEKIEEMEQKEETLKKEEESKGIKELYNKESKGDFREIDIQKNIITEYNKKFILKRNANLVFNYEFWANTNYHRGRNFSKVEDALINKNESYTKSENNIKIYDVDFSEKTKINDVEVSEAKLRFILNKINQDTTKETISLLNKLTGMKMDSINLKEIQLNYNDETIKVSIDISLIDENNFKIKFMDKEKDVNWEFVRKWFFEGGDTRSIHYHFTSDKLLEFSMEIGLIKQEIFDYLKKGVMINNLGEEEK